MRGCCTWHWATLGLQHFRDPNVMADAASMSSQSYREYLTILGAPVQAVQRNAQPEERRGASKGATQRSSSSNSRRQQPSSLTSNKHNTTGQLRIDDSK
eukprot:scaffold60918_cov13-Tisochrysis_lutea.AAC.1